MSNILKQIIETKKTEVEAAKQAIPYEVLLNQCAAMPPETRSMRQSIQNRQVGKRACFH